MSVSLERRLSVHQEHEFLLKLETAGLNEDLAQAVITSKDNVLAGNLLELASAAGIRDRVQRDQWVERELAFLSDYSVVCRDEIERAWRDGFTVHHRYVPGGLTRQSLLAKLGNLGVKLNGGNVNSADYPSGEQLPTTAGVLECDLATVMQPADAEHRPFMLDYTEHDVWCIEQGGSGLTSAEETLYLLLRMRLEFGRLLFMGGWIRCRNAAGSDLSVFVYFLADVGLLVVYDRRSARLWRWGCVPRKFSPLL